MQATNDPGRLGRESPPPPRIAEPGRGRRSCKLEKRRDEGCGRTASVRFCGRTCPGLPIREGLPFLLLPSLFYCFLKENFRVAEDQAAESAEFGGRGSDGMCGMADGASFACGTSKAIGEGDKSRASRGTADGHTRMAEI